MKKTLILALLLALAFIFTGCSVESSSGGSAGTTAANAVTTTATTAVTTAAAKDSGTAGDYSVTIKGFALAKDFDGKDVITVTYEWSNKSSDAEMFIVAFSRNVYQKGEECDIAVMSDDSATNQIKKIKDGASLEIKESYHIKDKTTPVEVSLTGIGDDNTIASKTFNIK